jgi:hypothetical protein
MRSSLLLILLLLPAWVQAAEPPANFPVYDYDGTELTIPQFVEHFIPVDMDRTAIQNALEDAGTNWIEFADWLAGWSYAEAFLDVNAGTPADPNYGRNPKKPVDRDILELWAWVLTHAPHLDRLELSRQMLSDNVNYALRVLPQPYSAYDRDFFRRYILNYRFDDEPVTNWRLPVGSAFTHPAASVYNHVKYTPQEIATVALSGFTIVERGYFGNLSDPVSILQSRAGTKRELSILVAAALRSQGYPTRFVRENRSGESWVEVYSGDLKVYDPAAWTPVYPTAPEHTGDPSYAAALCGGRITVITAGDAFGREQVTGRYSPEGWVRPLFNRALGDGEVEYMDDFTGWTITAWSPVAAGFVALDDLEYPSADKDYPLSGGAEAPPEGTYALGPGKYRLECGTRYPGGLSHVQTREFDIVAGETVALTLSLDPPADLPATALVERELGEFTDSPRLMHRGRYVFLVADGGEPSARAAELLRPLESLSSVYYQHWRMAGASDEERAFVKDVLKVADDDPLPVVIVVVDGKTRLYLRGYNLNVAQWVQRALEGE